MITITWIAGRSIKSIATPSASNASTVLFALRTLGYRARAWRKGELVA